MQCLLTAKCVAAGHGEYNTNRGESYVGMWRKDKRYDKGVWRSTRGDVYDGAWLDDFMHGEGTLTMSDGESYSGAWSMGKRGKVHGPWRTGQERAGVKYRRAHAAV